MTNALFISDFQNDIKEINLMINEIKKQGVTTEMISPKIFHLDVLFNQQYGHPKVKKFKQQVEASNQVYVIFQAWNKPLLWVLNALFNFLTKEELKGKCIVPVDINELKTNKNEVYQNFSTIFKDYQNETSSKWVFIQKEITSIQ